MPGALIDRPKMTKTMYQALKRHIMKERERKKQGIGLYCMFADGKKKTLQAMFLTQAPKPPKFIAIKAI